MVVEDKVSARGYAAPLHPSFSLVDTDDIRNFACVPATEADDTDERHCAPPNAGKNQAPKYGERLSQHDTMFFFTLVRVTCPVPLSLFDAERWPSYSTEGAPVGMSGLCTVRGFSRAPRLSCVPRKSAHGTEYAPLSQPVQRAHAATARSVRLVRHTRHDARVSYRVSFPCAEGGGLRALDALVWLARAIPLVIPPLRFLAPCSAIPHNFYAAAAAMRVLSLLVSLIAASLLNLYSIPRAFPHSALLLSSFSFGAPHTFSHSPSGSLLRADSPFLLKILLLPLPANPDFPPPILVPILFSPIFLLTRGLTGTYANSFSFKEKRGDASGGVETKTPRKTAVKLASHLQRITAMHTVSVSRARPLSTTERALMRMGHSAPQYAVDERGVTEARLQRRLTEESRQRRWCAAATLGSANEDGDGDGERARREAHSLPEAAASVTRWARRASHRRACEDEGKRGGGAAAFSACRTCGCEKEGECGACAKAAAGSVRQAGIHVGESSLTGEYGEYGEYGERGAQRVCSMYFSYAQVGEECVRARAGPEALSVRDTGERGRWTDGRPFRGVQIRRELTVPYARWMSFLKRNSPPIIGCCASYSRLILPFLSLLPAAAVAYQPPSCVQEGCSA
ncbi:hypothetical protein DFH06DRAFT_1482521 [Mycena polygramma]|nr:hypothetical protein DFH06DRAFT_1482521 [Mycena polygramma]